MIDKDTLSALGWSDELIAAVAKVDAAIDWEKLEGPPTTVIDPILDSDVGPLGGGPDTVSSLLFTSK